MNRGSNGWIHIIIFLKKKLMSGRRIRRRKVEREHPFDTVRWLRSRSVKGHGHVFTKKKYTEAYEPLLRNMFRTFDEDGSGSIDIRELHDALRSLLPKSKARAMLDIFSHLDGGDGQIDYGNFHHASKNATLFDSKGILFSSRSTRG